jgi:hypothetical protein
MLRPQRRLANLITYPFCDGNGNYVLTFQSQLKQYYMTKMKDQSSLPIFSKEDAVRCWTMHMVMCIFGVANGTACTMHSLAWDDPGEKKNAHNTIKTSTPGQVIDLPKPPDRIIVDIKPIQGIKWPHNLNLSPNSI